VTALNASDYLTQARANRSHVEWLLASRPGDPIVLQWAVTVAFYSALHGLNAHLPNLGIRVRSHMARDRALATEVNGVPSSVYTAYRDLEEASRDARYGLVSFTFQDVRQLLDRQLAVIATFVGM
jgi:hypothetical protein